MASLTSQSYRSSYAALKGYALFLVDDLYPYLNILVGSYYLSNTNEYTFKEALLFQHKGNFKEGLITSQLTNTLFQRITKCFLVGTILRFVPTTCQG